MAFPQLDCLCYILLLLLQFYAAASQTYRNVSLGSFLTARNGGADASSSWVSPSGEFAFGFRQIQKNQGFLLSIWFNEIPEKTVAWSANGDTLVPVGSKVELTDDGRLVLTDPAGQQIWSASDAGSASSGVAYAAMLDTGNFILATRGGVSSWRSFDSPTDTMLPTQRMSRGSRLISRFSETNYSRGKFQFALDSDGDLALDTISLPTESVNYNYWSLKTNGSGFQVIFNQSGKIYLTANNGSILNQTFVSSNEASAGDFYCRAILEYDGVLRQYVHPKNSTGGRMGWSTSTFIPSNICMSIVEGTGDGVCGFNGYCSLGDDDQRPKCECPPGFTLLDPNNTMRGCRQDFVSQNCEAESVGTDSFELRAMDNTDWPLSDYEHSKPVLEDQCRQSCLGDCFCAVAIFRDGDCWKKKIPLSNGRYNLSVGGKALIKVRKNDSNPSQHPPPSVVTRKKDQSTLIITEAALLGSSVCLNFLLLLGTCLYIFRSGRTKPMLARPCSENRGINLQSFTYAELENATDGFTEELGTGAYASVYKGSVTFATGSSVVAVKKLEKAANGGGEKEFEAEVNAIGRTNHKHLVQLLGFCNEGQHRLLVYEFMSRGSLASFLFGDPRPEWSSRIQIAFGTARGLLYLHEECSTQIIHCDVKPQNILLDGSLMPKICDFGLAKLLRMDQTQTMTAIRGTKGYVAPEWFRTVPITAKVDVYSFGIVLLELIFCRKNFEAEASNKHEMVLSEWAYDCYRNGELGTLVKNDEEAKADMQRLEKFVIIAMWCVQGDPSVRPSMRRVLQMLEGAVEVPPPPDPSSFLSSIQSS